jgi:hypothetical protein
MLRRPVRRGRLAGGDRGVHARRGGSLFAICDGKTAMLFGWAQDHKRAFDGEVGPNTGGMGTYSPAPVFTDALVDEVRAKISPTGRGHGRRGRALCRRALCRADG